MDWDKSLTDEEMQVALTILLRLQAASERDGSVASGPAASSNGLLPGSEPSQSHPYQSPVAALSAQ